MLIKHEAKLSTLLALRPRAKRFILHIAQARQRFYCFIEFSSLIGGIVQVSLILQVFKETSWPRLAARSCSLPFIYKICNMP